MIIYYKFIYNNTRARALHLRIRARENRRKNAGNKSSVQKVPELRTLFGGRFVAVAEAGRDLRISGSERRR